jgi:hypothetical protein
MGRRLKNDGHSHCSHNSVHLKNQDAAPKEPSLHRHSSLCAQRKPKNTLYKDQQWFGGNATADNSTGLSVSFGHKTNVKYFVWE